MIKKTLNLKLRMKPAQAGRLQSIFDVCVSYHNAMLARGELILKDTAKFPNLSAQQRDIKILRPVLDPQNLAHTHLLQDVCKRISLSRAAYFRNLKLPPFLRRKVNLPKEKGVYRSSIFKEHGNGYKIIMNDDFISRIKIFDVGTIRFFEARRLPKDAKICTATIKKKTEGFFLSLVYEFEPAIKDKTIRIRKPSPMFPYSNIKNKPSILRDVGIDLGIASFVATSDGDKFSCPLLESHFQQLKLLNAKKRRKIKEAKKASRASESRRLSALRRGIAKQHEKIRRVRRDFLRKVASYLVSNYDQIFYEDLVITGLIEKGKDFGHDYVRRIHSAGWGMFIIFLCRRAAGTLSRVGAVDPRWTSCICPYCFHGERKALAQRIHCCSECGATMDRDEAGARIVKISGLNPELLSVSKAKLAREAMASRAGNLPTAEAPTSIRLIGE